MVAQGDIEKGLRVWMGGPGRASWHSPCSPRWWGSSPVPSYRALDRQSLEAATAPLRGVGMLQPEGSVAAGLGGGAWLIPQPPPTPRGLGEGEAPTLACPTLTGRWAWRPLGRLPWPSRPEGCLSSPSSGPALLFAAEAPELSKGRYSSPQCSSVWLLSKDPGPPSSREQSTFCLLPGMFVVTFCPGTQNWMSP